MVNVINFLAREAILAPGGLWSTLFNWFESWIGNYGWTILLFTIFVKLIMLPLEFYNRYQSRKNNFIQKRLSGQVAKLNEKYKNNRDQANQAISSLYKREGYNMVGTCVFTLLNLVITLVVFISFFNTLRDISAYQMLDQYRTLEEAYNITLEQTGDTSLAEDAVLVKYEDMSGKSQWLWVKNIWKNDSNVSVVPNYAELNKSVNNAHDKKYKAYFNAESELYISEADYNKVMAKLIDGNDAWNGYFILAILSGVLSFLSQYLSELQNNSKKEKGLKQKSAQEEQMQKTMGFMRILLPAMMVIFALTSSASFGIYLIASSLIGIITNFVTGIFVNKLTRKEEEKYLAWLEKEALHQAKKNHNQQQKPQMVNYKSISGKM